MITGSFDRASKETFSEDMDYIILVLVRPLLVFWNAFFPGFTQTIGHLENEIKEFIFC